MPRNCRTITRRVPANSSPEPSCKTLDVNEMIVTRLLSTLGIMLALLTSCSGPRLRTDLSATVTYVGKHNEILLDCTNMYGAFGNRVTKKGERVQIPSVRDDGRIVVEWGPDHDSKQRADLHVGPEVPADGPSVTVDITLTDDGATYSIRQDN